MRKVTKRIWAFMLVFAMVLTMMPMTAKADGGVEEELKIEGVSMITSENMFVERMDDEPYNTTYAEHYEAMRENQKAVKNVSFDEGTNTITVEINKAWVEPTAKNPDNSGEEKKKYVAIMVKFNDLSKLASNPMFSTNADAKDCGITDNNSVIFWMNVGTENADNTDNFTITDTKGMTTTYTLVRKNYTKSEAIISEVSPITSENMFVKRMNKPPYNTTYAKHYEAMRENQKAVKSVKFDKETNIITVDIDKSAVEPTAKNPDDSGEEKKKYVAIMVKFNDLSKLASNPMFSTNADAKDCGITDDNSVIFWMNVGTEDTDNTDNFTITDTKDLTTTYTLVRKNHICDSNKVSGGASASCTSSGYTSSRYCSVCGKLQSAGSTIPARGHKLSAVAAKPATCTEDGTIAHYACSSCGKKFSDAEGKTAITDTVEKATGHKEEVLAAKEATCTEEGLKEGKKCSVCNEVLVEQEKVEALGHKIVAVAAKEATYEAEGCKAHYACSTCGATFADAEGKEAIDKASVTIPKLVKDDEDGGSTTADGKPGITNKVQASTTKSDAIKFAWAPVAGATGYRVYVAKDGKWVQLAKAWTGTSFTADDLAAGTEYKFAVRAYKIEDGEVTWANGYKAINLTTAPGVAKTMKVGRGYTSLKFTWNAVKGATGYRVYQAQNGKWVQLQKAQTAKTFTKKGLKSGATYKFAVRAYRIENGKVVWADTYKSVTAKTVKK